MENQGDNSIKFKVYRGVLTEEQREIFNSEIDKIYNKIIKIAHYVKKEQKVPDNILSNFNKLSKKGKKDRKKSFLNKAVRVSNYLSKKEKNRYEFKDIIKQIFLNINLSYEINKILRYSRNKNFFGKQGVYTKMFIKYDPFTFAIDSLALLDYISSNIGTYYHKKKKGYQSEIELKNKGLSVIIKLRNISFIDDTKKDFIIMKDEKGDVVPVYKPDRITRSEKKVKMINDKLDKVDIQVNGSFFSLSETFLDSLYIYLITNVIELYELEFILLKNHTKELQFIDQLITNYNLTKVTEEREINKLGESYRLPLVRKKAEPERDFSELICHGSDGLFIKKIHFKINKKFLYRVFSRNNWMKNGRFFGGLWENLPSAVRKHIYCDGEKMISLDFSAMHPRMCYHLLEKPCEHDPYIITGYGKAYREHFKCLCLRSINAKDEKDAILSTIKKLKEDGIDSLEYTECKELLKAFKAQHNEISRFICSDFGIDAMLHDSNIIEDSMKELMVKQNITVLPVHDELLCSASNEGIVREQMILSYRKIMKDALVKKRIMKRTDLLPEYIVPVIG